MFTQPDDLSNDQVAATLLEGWGIHAQSITYVALGFGSHHWLVETSTAKWFVTVGDLHALRRNPGDTRSIVRGHLGTALRSALKLSQQGLEFVVAPVVNHAGTVLADVDERYVLALYPHIEGRVGSWGRYDSQVDLFAVVDRLVQIHAADQVGSGLGAEDFSIPSRHQLLASLELTASTWTTGPFGEATRALLMTHADALLSALAWYDDLVDIVRSCGHPLVVTHGEPHAGNVIFTPAGPSLIDWDTALLAPPERDLWSLIREDPKTAEYYSTQAGRALDDTTLQLYQLWWDLCEISLYVAEFSVPHIETTDTHTAWRGLEEHLDPSRWTAVR